MEETRFYEDVAAFWAAARDLYEAEPVKHTTALSVIHALSDAPQPDAAPPVFVTLHDTAGSLLGAALRTPPWPMALSGIRPDDVSLLTKELLVAHPELDSVMGPQDVVDAFAASWSAATSRLVRPVLDLRLYRLADLVVPQVEGRSRLATEADLDLLAQHNVAFSEEANAHHPMTFSDAVTGVRRQLTLGAGYVIWDVDGVPVSSACAKVPNAGASRIGPVYTPPAHRAHGYAAAATSAAASWALSAGATEVLLYTDLANPTSNGVYQRIGFRPVADYAEIAFDHPA